MGRSAKDGSFSIDDLVNILCSQYEVDKETAKKDAEALAAQWGESGYH